MPPRDEGLHPAASLCVGATLVRGTEPEASKLPDHNVGSFLLHNTSNTAFIERALPAFSGGF